MYNESHIESSSLCALLLLPSLLKINLKPPYFPLFSLLDPKYYKNYAKSKQTPRMMTTRKTSIPVHIVSAIGAYTMSPISSIIKVF